MYKFTTVKSLTKINKISGGNNNYHLVHRQLPSGKHYVYIYSVCTAHTNW